MKQKQKLIKIKTQINDTNEVDKVKKKIKVTKAFGKN